MSRLMLLTTVGVAPGGTGGGGEEPPPDPGLPGWPDPLDATIAAIRPSIAPLATLTVDPGAAETGTNFHTINGALTEAADRQTEAVQQSSLGTEFSTLGSPLGPDYRVDILIAAGDYDEGMGNSGPVCLIGPNPNDPSDVVIHSDTTGGGVLHSFAPVYLENLTIRSEGVGTVPSGPKYPWHITNGQRGGSIAANVVFEEPNTGGEGSVGMDGGGGTTALFYRCEFPTGTNLHGAVGATEPVTVMFIDCTLTEDVGYTQLGDVFDEFWFIGNTGASFSTSGDVNEHTTGTWPVPNELLSALDEDYYLPSSIRGPFPVTQTYGAADQAAFSPVLNRVYYVPVTVSAAIHWTHVGVVAAAAGGVAGVRAVRDDQPPDDDPAPGRQSLGTLASGVNEIAVYYFNTWYPGETVLWVLVEATSGTPSLQGSLALAAGAYYSDDDGATVLPVASGRVPVVRLKSVS